MNYVIRDVTEGKKINVFLEKYGDDICLYVGEWAVFELKYNGAGYRCGGILVGNKEGLQVDDNGRIILEEDDE